jgi:large subunit ribosomal protein L6
MKKDLERVIEIPEGVECVVNGKNVSIKGNGKELSKEFDIGKLSLATENNSLKISCKNSSRRESKMIGTIWAHINNMIKGLNEDFVYELEICNAHFPMNVKLDGERVIIKSFLGETKERISKVIEGVKVEIKGIKITVSSYDIEKAGQTAANLEKATRLRGRDRRIFQDGIFITKKCGREI